MKFVDEWLLSKQDELVHLFWNSLILFRIILFPIEPLVYSLNNHFHSPTKIIHLSVKVLSLTEFLFSLGNEPYNFETLKQTNYEQQ